MSQHVVAVCECVQISMILHVVVQHAIVRVHVCACVCVRCQCVQMNMAEMVVIWELKICVTCRLYS